MSSRHNAALTPGSANFVFLVLVVVFLGAGMFLAPTLGLGFNSWLFQALMLAIALGLAYFKKWPLLRLFRINGPGIVPLLAGFLLGIGMWWANISIHLGMELLLNELLGPLPELLPVLNLLDTLFLLLTMFVMAPVCEEFLFRGYFMRAYESVHPRRPWFIVGVLFGLMHVGSSISNAVTATIMGWVLGYIAFRHESLLVAVAAHGGANFSAGAFGWLVAGASGNFIPLWTLIMSILGTVTSALLLWYFHHVSPPSVPCTAGNEYLGQGLDHPFWRRATISLALLLLMIPVILEIGMRLEAIY